MFHFILISTFNFLPPAKKYPFYAVQWHPEKNNFEWTTKEEIPHSEHAVAVSQLTADFLVQEGQFSCFNEARGLLGCFHSDKPFRYATVYMYTQ